MNPDEAKLLSHVEHDGSLNHKTARYFNTSLVLINDFRDTFRKCFGVDSWTTFRNKTAYETGTGRKNIVNVLLEYQCDKCNLLTNRENARSYLSAAFDDEGSIKFLKKKRGYDREITFWSKDFQQVDLIKNLLNDHFEIRSKIYGPYKGTHHELKIMDKSNIQLFSDEIPLIHPQKQDALKRIIASI